MLERRVRGQDSVVRFNHRGGDLRRGINGELELGLLAVVHGETLHQQAGESWTGTTAERVEYQETLETGAHVGDLANSVEDQIDDLLAEGVVTPSVIVRRVLFAGDQLLGVE